MNKKQQSSLKMLQVGRNIILKFSGDKEQHVYTSAEKEKREELKKLVDNYNKLPSESKKDKIIRFVTPKTQAALVAKTVEKKKVHQEKKVVKQKMVESKKFLAEESEAIRKIFGGDDRFVSFGGQVYLAGFETIPMPIQLVNTIRHELEAKRTVDHLVNFWKLCLLNPNPIARTKLFGYLSRHKLLITPHGYIVTFRMVKTTDDPNVFTSNHTRQEKYIIGQPYRIPRSECDEDGAHDCSRGLHTGTPNFLGINGLELLGDGYVNRGAVKILSKNQGGGQGTGYDLPKVQKIRQQTFSETFGNQAVVCLVNPMHVVSVPDSDTRKMRSCELFFVKKTTPEEVVNLHLNDFTQFDHDYHTLEQEEINKMLKEHKLENFFDPKVPVDYSEMTKAELKAFKEKMTELKEKLGVKKDKINQELTLEEINSIIRSRR